MRLVLLILAAWLVLSFLFGALWVLVMELDLQRRSRRGGMVDLTGRKPRARKGRPW